MPRGARSPRRLRPSTPTLTASAAQRRRIRRTSRPSVAGDADTARHRGSRSPSRSRTPAISISAPIRASPQELKPVRGSPVLEDGSAEEEAPAWLLFEVVPVEPLAPVVPVLCEPDDGADEVGVDEECFFAVGEEPASGSVYCSLPALCAIAAAGIGNRKSAPASASARTRITR